MSNTLTRLPLLTRLGEKDIAFLVSAGTAPRISLYLPLDKSWREPLEDKVLLRDLRRNAVRLLEVRDVPPSAMEALLAPLDSLLSEPDASHFQGQGLALFTDGNQAVMLLLPSTPAPMVQVDVRFRLDGVLTQIQGRDRYALLSLSQHSVHLWDCDGLGIREIPLTGLETDIRRTQHYQEAEYQSMFHTNSAGHHGNRSHGEDSGHYSTGPGDGKGIKKEIESFFRMIDHGIQALLPAGGLPLVLAGVGFLLPIYRRVNTYPALLQNELPGSSEALGSVENLHLRANALLQERERAIRNQALGIYVENLTRSRSCAGYTDLVPCACQSRLTHLFVAQGQAQWGAYDTATGRTTLYDAYRPGAEDLANLACVSAVQAKASAYALPVGELPAGADIAGLYRS